MNGTVRGIFKLLDTAVTGIACLPSDDREAAPNALCKCCQ